MGPDDLAKYAHAATIKGARSSGDFWIFIVSFL
jgi:hypothetical protein